MEFDCEVKHCSNLMYFERKGKFIYLYIAKFPEGPTVKYQMIDGNQSDDTRFLGNSLKGSRPIIVFGKEFKESLENKI